MTGFPCAPGQAIVAQFEKMFRGNGICVILAVAGWGCTACSCAGLADEQVTGCVIANIAHEGSAQLTLHPPTTTDPLAAPLSLIVISRLPITLSISLRRRVTIF